MENITLYSTHCPQCTALERQLKQKNIPYHICDDTAIMIAKGFSSAPILEVNGQCLRFKDALTWVRGK